MDAKAALAATPSGIPLPPVGPPLTLPTFSTQSQQTCTHIRLLSKSLADFQTIAMTEHSAWLLSIAHDICGPQQPVGMLFRLDSQAPVLWTVVNPGDPLEAKIYEYKPLGSVRLSKLSQRNNQSQTNISRAPSSSTMAAHVRRRDLFCWCCGFDRVSKNSRAIPKRMGDIQTRLLVDEWCGMTGCQWTSYADELGVRLCGNHDDPFDVYNLGFRHVPNVGVNTYAIHRFDPDEQSQLYGICFTSPPQFIIEHGSLITAPDPTHHRNLPPGVLAWHYLQCVIRWFAHDDYHNFPNIAWYELPFRDREEEEDEFDCEEEDLSKLWPSAYIDRGLFESKRREEEAAKAVSVGHWLSKQVPDETNVTKIQ